MSNPRSSSELPLGSPGEMTEAESRAERSFVRTIPGKSKVTRFVTTILLNSNQSGWVQSVELDDEEAAPTSRLLSSPTSAQIAQHNFSPAPKYKAEPGRLHDSYRTRDPVIMTAPGDDWASRWRSFALATAEPIPPSQRGQRVSEDWWKEHMTDYSKPWNVGGEHGVFGGDSGGIMSKTKRKAWYHRANVSVVYRRWLNKLSLN